MIRWFRGRKHKRKCNESSDDSSTEYGFKDSTSRDISPYGFRKSENCCVQVADIVPKEDVKSTIDYSVSSTGLHGSSSPHIYDEIKDLPDNIIASQFRILTGLKFTSSQDEDKVEGPYMVVPVLPARRIPAKSSAIAKSLTKVSSRSHNDVSKISFDKKDDDMDCTTEITYAELRESSLKPRTDESKDLFTGIKNERNSVALPVRISNLQSNENDSVYDLNSSGASSESDYPVFLDKIEQNLFLKEQVREIIRSLSRGDSEHSGCNRTDSFSTVSTESSTISSVPTSTSGEVSDPEVFADQSESEDENEYHECTHETMVVAVERAKQETEVNNIEGKSDVTNSVQKHKKRSSKSRKPKFKIYAMTDHDHENKLKSVIQEDMEMYLLPSCKKEIDYYNYKSCRKPVLVPTLPTRIYQDPNRLKNNKNNKLLGDLIRMNYDKQHLILV